MSNTFSTPSVVTTLSQSRLDYNEALLTLLQNFASAGQPSGSEIISDGTTGLRTGMLWYKSGADTSDGQGRMLVYNGAEFTRNGLAVYKMPSTTAANAAVVASKISYGELVTVGSDALFMVNAANTGVLQIGSDASTLSGLVSTQFVRTDASSTITANLTFSGTGFIKVPFGNDSQRPGTPAAGMLRFSNTSGSFEGYDGTEWGEIGGGGAFTDDGTYVFYTGSANVGIGIATPEANLHVKGTGNLLRLETGTSTDANGVTVRFLQTDTSIVDGQGYGSIEWSGSDTGNDGVRGYIKGVSEGDSGQFAVRIGTQGTGASAPTDQVTIDNEGRVGIGTVSPNVRLQVAGNIHMSGGDATIFNRTNHYLALGTNNIEALRILQNTNIGVGISAPTANLHIAGAGSVLKLQTGTTTDNNGVSLRFLQTDTTIADAQGYGGVEWEGFDAEGNGIRSYIKAFSEGTAGQVGLRVATQATGISSPIDRFFIKSTGNVGIGVSNPQANLQVEGLTFSNTAHFANSNIAHASISTVVVNNLTGNTTQFTSFIGGGLGITNLNAANVTTGIIATDRLATGTANAFTYLRGDQTWAQIAPGGAGAYLENDVTTNNNNFYIAMATSNTAGSWANAYVSSTKLYFNPALGQLNAFTYNATSDARLKENIEVITNAIDRLKLLEGVLFNFIGSDAKLAGLIAQQVIKALPEAVTESDTGSLTVNYNAVLGLVVQAFNEYIKDTDNRIRVLEERILDGR